MAIAHDFHAAPRTVSTVGDDRRSTAALSTLFGSAGLALIWLPVLNYLAVALGALGLVCGALGIIRNGRALAVTGTALSLTTILLGFAIFASLGS